VKAGQPETGLVIAAHGALAEAFVQTASGILGSTVDAVTVTVDDAADAFGSLGEAVKAADQGVGVLVLADLFGGSAANMALAHLDGNVEVVTGVNLAMVLEAVTHRSSPVAELAAKVAAASKNSVVVAGNLLGSRSAA
jgi:PTS system mannose-specific IIA component